MDIPPITADDVRAIRAELDCSMLTAAKVAARRRALGLIDKLEADIDVHPEYQDLDDNARLKLISFILRYLVERQ